MINSLKPLTPDPTIADSLYSIIIVSTIAYTASSILGNSAFISRISRSQNLIDGITYIIVAGLVIGYFGLSNYPFHVLIWVVPVILIGLGYGLLLRIVGVNSIFPRKVLLIKRKQT